MALQNILPDPSNQITSQGTANAGSYGPGFASVKINSTQKIMRDRTNSGIVTSRAQSYHMWSIDITYNPMTREEFDPIYSFLLEKQGSFKPFKVSLPQYKNNENRNIIASASAYTAGKSQLLVDLQSDNNDAKVGDLFHITDPGNSNHTKAYKIVRIETNGNLSGADDDTADDPDSGEMRITFVPPLQSTVETSNSFINLTTPLIQVIQKGDVQEYSLNTENLYSFSLKLEEACY